MKDQFDGFVKAVSLRKSFEVIREISDCEATNLKIYTNIKYELQKFWQVEEDELNA